MKKVLIILEKTSAHEKHAQQKFTTKQACISNNTVSFRL